MALIDSGLIAGGIYLLYEVVDRLNIADGFISFYRGKYSVNDYELIVGHCNDFAKKVITVDLKVFPSFSITGISNCGKSKLVEYMLMNTKLPIVLINAYEDDFKNVKCRRIVEIKAIEKYLDYLLNEKDNEHPILVIFDEALTLMSYKNIAKKIHTLLTKNRHKKIYVVAIFQELNKTIVPFKSLFTARLTMRAIQVSDINSALGTTIEDYKPLKNREFILLSDDIYWGKTYDV